MEIKKSWGSDRVSISTNDKINFANNYYLNIFQDFIIEVFLDEKVEKEINFFYQSYSKITEENRKIFEGIFLKKRSVRMKISRNKTKATLLRKKLSRDFFIPKHLHLY